MTSSRTFRYVISGSLSLITVGKKRVARLMKAHGIVVKTRRKYMATTSSKHDLPIAKNVLDRKFAVDAIGATDRVWAGDITYVWTLEGWLYLAVVLDFVLVASSAGR